MSLPQTSLDMAKAQHRRSTISTIPMKRLATVTEKFTEKLNLSSYALYLSDIGASVGFRLAVMHPERVTALIVQNGGAHVEAINKEFLQRDYLTIGKIGAKRTLKFYSTGF